MRFIIILSVINVLYGKHDVKHDTKHVKEKVKTKCEGISVNGKIHKEEVLINGIDRPYQLSYHGKRNHSTVLYFSYNFGRLNESTFEIGYAKDGARVPNPIKTVKNGFATAVNLKHNLIYFGGSEGIYSQNLSTPGEVVSLGIKHNIWDLFYKDELYFITFPKRRLHKHVAGKSSEILTHIHEKIYQFAIDGEDDTFITNKTGLFVIKNGTHHRIHVDGPRVFRAIAVDSKGVAYFAGQNEVYVLDKENNELHEIVKVKNIFGLTFDHEDNMIFSDPHQIVKLLPKDCND